MFVYRCAEIARLMTGYAGSGSTVSEVYYDDLWLPNDRTLKNPGDVLTRKKCAQSSTPQQPFTYCLPSDYVSGIAITGNVDKKGETYRTQLDVGRWDEPVRLSLRLSTARVFAAFILNCALYMAFANSPTLAISYSCVYVSLVRTGAPRTSCTRSRSRSTRPRPCRVSPPAQITRC